MHRLTNAMERRANLDMMTVEDARGSWYIMQQKNIAAEEKLQEMEELREKLTDSMEGNRVLTEKCAEMEEEHRVF